MSDSIMLTFDQLPVEILCGVFLYLDVPDIVRMRRISRRLNALSHSKSVWSDIYRSVEFVRPPGPFPSQTAHDLENNLVLCFRMDRNLSNYSNIPDSCPAHKLGEVRWSTAHYIGLSLVFGRFLLVALMHELRCYDLDVVALGSDLGATILYKPTDAVLKSFHCVSSTDIEGQPFACIVLGEVTGPDFTGKTSQIFIHSLKVVEKSEIILELLHQSEHCDYLLVDFVDVGPHALVVRGRMRGATDHTRQLITALNVHTRTQLPLPSYSQVSAKVPDLTICEEIVTPASISTSTHLLLARGFSAKPGGYCTFLQAFALSHAETHRHSIPPSTPLSPSHCGVIPGIIIHDAALLHDTVFDGSTQDILITIRVKTFKPQKRLLLCSKYGVLRLRAGHTHSSHSEPGSITFRLLGHFIPHVYATFPRPSLNGTGRMFYTGLILPSTRIKMSEYRVRGDGGGERDKNGFIEPKITDNLFLRRLGTKRRLMDYDPYSGRICLQPPMGEYQAIEIFDLDPALVPEELSDKENEYLDSDDSW